MVIASAHWYVRKITLPSRISEKRTVTSLVHSRVENGIQYRAIGDTLEKKGPRSRCPLYRTFYDVEEPPDIAESSQQSLSDRHSEVGTTGQRSRASANKLSQLVGHSRREDRTLILTMAKNGQPA